MHVNDFMETSQDSASMPTPPLIMTTKKTKKVSSVNLAYTAGLIDGEGSILLTRHHRKSNRAPSIMVPNCSKELLDFLQTNFGGVICSKRARKKHHTPSFHWTVYYDRAIRIMAQILPYVQHLKKRRRIIHILTHYKGVTRRNGQYNTKQRKAKQRFEAAFFKL